jgi:4-hydroxybutyrate CoA-transferase
MRHAILSLLSLFLPAMITTQAAQAAGYRRVLTRELRKELMQIAAPAHLRRPGAGVPQRLTATQAAQLIEPGDHVYFPVGHMASPALVNALIERTRSGIFERPIHVVGLTNSASRKLFDRRGRVRAMSLFNGASNRDAVARGHGTFVPAHYSRIPQLIRQGAVRIDKAVFMVSRPDAAGYVTLGTSTAESLAALAKTRLAIAEVNPHVPQTRGASRVHISHFSALVDGEAPLKVLPPEPVGELESRIAEHIAGLVPDGATLQFGIGGIPNAVAERLASQGRKGFRVWTELVSDGIVALVNAGAVKGPAVYAFAWGSGKTLAALDGSRRYFALPIDVVNSSQLLPRLPKLVAINGALEVDLFGNVNAQKRGAEMYTGVGGQRDFMAGATQAPNGRSIIALPSTATVAGKRVSRIVPRLESGLATTSMHDVKHVVTEHGVAELDGKGDVERARALIEIADPRFRARLTRALEAELSARRSAERTRDGEQQAARQSQQPVGAGQK